MLVGDTPESWPVRSSRDLHRDAWIVALREDQVSLPNASSQEESFTRLVVEHPGAAVVIAIDDDDRVICLRQYRHAGQHRFLELPAGLLDTEGEGPLPTAQRELREEAELAASDWIELPSTYPSPGLSAEVHHYFLATGLSPASRGNFELHHEEAEMELVRVPFADLLRAAIAGEVRDAPLVLATFYAAAQRGLMR